MPLKVEPAGERLVRVLRRELRQESVLPEPDRGDSGRYWRVTWLTGVLAGRPVYVRHGVDVGATVEREARGLRPDRDRTYEPVSDELDKALKLNDADTRQMWLLLVRAVEQLAGGCYDREIVDEVRKLLDARGLDRSSRLLGELPEREGSGPDGPGPDGPLVEWVRHAVYVVTQLHRSLHISRQEMIRLAEGGSEPA